MAHPLELEFVEICQAALEEEWKPGVMRLGKSIHFPDGSFRPVLEGVVPGDRVMAGTPAHYCRWRRETIVELAARTCQSRSRKIRSVHRPGRAARRLRSAA